MLIGLGIVVTVALVLGILGEIHERKLKARLDIEAVRKRELLAKQDATCHNPDVLDGASQATALRLMRKQSLEEAVTIIRNMKHERCMTPEEDVVYDEALKDVEAALVQRMLKLTEGAV